MIVFKAEVFLKREEEIPRTMVMRMQETLFPSQRGQGSVQINSDGARGSGSRDGDLPEGRNPWVMGRSRGVGDRPLALAGFGGERHRLAPYATIEPKENYGREHPLGSPLWGPRGG